MMIANIMGTIALVTSFIGLLPQSYKAFKTRSTQDLSMLMLMNYLVCSLAWIIYGICIHSPFVLYSNLVGAVSSITLIFQKQYYDKYAIAH